ncbi:MAG TPA: universal stress protein [Acidimicrobiales bacterium]|nr:universal stress protein [Acidimicrobiales bacterium]
MTTVLAAIDDSPAAAPVLRGAQALAGTLGIDVRALHVVDNGGDTAAAVAVHAAVPVQHVRGDPTAAIIDAAAGADVAVVAVGARRDATGARPAGHVARAVMTGAVKPVLVVAPDARLPTDGRFRRALLPLDGTAKTSVAVEDVVRRLTTAGVDVVAVHVFASGTVPRFWDQAGHADQSWAAEFLARCCVEAPDAELRLRTGDVGGAAIDVATEEAIDLVVLGWSQHLERDRAQVVRDIVGRADVAILLVPTA